MDRSLKDIGVVQVGDQREMARGQALPIVCGRRFGLLGQPYAALIGNLLKRPRSIRR